MRCTDSAIRAGEDPKTSLNFECWGKIQLGRLRRGGLYHDRHVLCDSRLCSSQSLRQALWEAQKCRSWGPPSLSVLFSFQFGQSLFIGFWLVLLNLVGLLYAWHLFLLDIYVCVRARLRELWSSSQWLGITTRLRRWSICWPRNLYCRSKPITGRYSNELEWVIELGNLFGIFVQMLWGLRLGFRIFILPSEIWNLVIGRIDRLSCCNSWVD